MFIVRTALLCFIVLLLVISGALYLGHQQPDDTLLLDLQRCHDRICALTIAPDVTPYNEALAILGSTPQLDFPSSVVAQAYKRSPPFYTINLYATQDSARITEIELSFNSVRLLTMNRIVAKFGPPCAVIPRYIPDYIILLYPGMVVYVETNAPANVRRFMPSARVIQINLLNNSLPDCSHFVFSDSQVRWRGFSNY